jgi:hypothetical protein
MCNRKLLTRWCQLLTSWCEGSHTCVGLCTIHNSNIQMRVRSLSAFLSHNILMPTITYNTRGLPPLLSGVTFGPSQLHVLTRSVLLFFQVVLDTKHSNMPLHGGRLTSPYISAAYRTHRSWYVCPQNKHSHTCRCQKELLIVGFLGNTPCIHKKNCF